MTFSAGFIARRHRKRCRTRNLSRLPDSGRFQQLRTSSPITLDADLRLTGDRSRQCPPSRKAIPRYIPSPRNNKQTEVKGGRTMMHSTRLCVIISVLAALIAGMMIATTARADALRGDPRKCSFSSDPRVCAYEAARLVLRHFLAVRTNSSTPFYQGITSCSPATTTTILRWKCSWGAATNAGPPAGTAIVVFRALSTGWKRQVTVTSG